MEIKQNSTCKKGLYNACVAYSEYSTNVDYYCGIVLSWEDCVNELKWGEFQNSLGQVE